MKRLLTQSLIVFFLQTFLVGSAMATNVSPSADTPTADPPHSGNPVIGEQVKVKLHASDTDAPPMVGTTPCTPTWSWSVDDVQFGASSMDPWASSSASVSITHPDPMGDSPDDAILEGTFSDAGEYKITVTANLSYDCGPSDSSSLDITITIDPGIDHLEFSSDGGATWNTFPSGGLYVGVRSVPDQERAGVFE